jgi:protein-tyrosine phosphatase
MKASEPYRILFVCMGNICRSPMAEGLFRHTAHAHGQASRFLVDSAGTHPYRPGHPPDATAQAVAAQKGVNIGQGRSRGIVVADFQQSDAIVAMDRANLDALQFVCPRSEAKKVRLLLDDAPHLKLRDVPDPYGGSLKDFERAFDLIEQGVQGLWRRLQADLMEDN